MVYNRGQGYGQPVWQGQSFQRQYGQVNQYPAQRVLNTEDTLNLMQENYISKKITQWSGRNSSNKLKEVIDKITSQYGNQIFKGFEDLMDKTDEKLNFAIGLKNIASKCGARENFECCLRVIKALPNSKQQLTFVRSLGNIASKCLEVDQFHQYFNEIISIEDDKNKLLFTLGLGKIAHKSDSGLEFKEYHSCTSEYNNVSKLTFVISLGNIAHKCENNKELRAYFDKINALNIPPEKSLNLLDIIGAIAHKCEKKESFNMCFKHIFAHNKWCEKIKVAETLEGLAQEADTMSDFEKKLVIFLMDDVATIEIPRQLGVTEASNNILAETSKLMMEQNTEDKAIALGNAFANIYAKCGTEEHSTNRNFLNILKIINKLPSPFVKFRAITSLSKDASESVDPAIFMQSVANLDRAVDEWAKGGQPVPKFNISQEQQHAIRQELIKLIRQPAQNNTP